MKPFFSVIIPVYNKAKYIYATITSVLNQSYENFEIIIVNDGSTDSCLEIIKSIKDNRITILDQENLGLSTARNNGIKLAKHDYIALLDADDLWCDNYLKNIKMLITTYPNTFVYATASALWHRKTPPILNSEILKKNEIQHITNYFELAKNIFSYSSIVFHKSVFDSIGLFNENVNYGEEEDFTIRCFLKFDLAYSNIAQVYYLQGDENQMTLPNKETKRIIPDFDIYLKNNTNLYLKKYIDFVHFKILVLYKMEKRHDLVNLYKQKIFTKSLTAIQKIKYHLPTWLFYITKQFYLRFSKRFIHS